MVWADRSIAVLDALWRRLGIDKVIAAQAQSRRLVSCPSHSGGFRRLNPPERDGRNTVRENESSPGVEGLYVVHSE